MPAALSHRPFQRCDRDPGGARLWIFLIAFAIGVLGIVIVQLAAPDRHAVIDTDVGDCFSLPINRDTTTLETVELVDCDQPHDVEVVATGELNPLQARDYPSDELLFDLVDVMCGDPRRFKHLGFGVLPVAPDERAWNELDGRFVCLAVTEGERKVSGRQIDVGGGADSATA